VTVSARTGANIEEWFDRILEGAIASRESMDVDYDIYAEGEALLGWLNATANLSSDAPFEGNNFVEALANRIQGKIAVAGFEIAHLKMTLTPDRGSDLAVLNLVRSDGQAEHSHYLADDITEGELIVNVRAEGDPDHLRTIVGSALTESAAERGVNASIVHCEHFRPARPQPTHRLAAI
jgi:hypothetical protein